MRNLFVKTSNFEAFRTGITAVEERGAAEASLMLVDGDAGYGKSKTVDYWAVQKNAVYLRAKVQWTPGYFMHELCDQLKIDNTGRNREIFARIAASVAGQQIPLVVDEVEHCLNNGAKVLEAIRDLSDLTEVLVILVGMERVQVKIARYAQISSRIAKVVEFKAATLDDVQACCEQLAEVKIEQELVQEIHTQSAGRMREIMNAIAMCERTAKRNALDSIGLKHLAGQSLVHDWQSRRPRLVKAVGSR